MLGMVVGRGTRTVQPGKAQALRDWPMPTKAEHVVSFRAFANYLRSFIPNFLEIDQQNPVTIDTQVHQLFSDPGQHAITSCKKHDDHSIQGCVAQLTPAVPV